MPVSPVPQKRAYRRTAETQELIFEKAIALMSEKGFQGTTVREICTQAGIPVGTFYNCFKSKMDILRRIYDSGDDYVKEAVSREAEGKSSLDTLMIFARHYANLNIRTGIEVMRVLYYPENEWFSLDRPMQMYLREIIRSGQESGEIRRDLNGEGIENCIFDILRGVCYNWCVCDGKFDLVERIVSHFQLFCASISQKQNV